MALEQEVQKINEKLDVIVRNQQIINHNLPGWKTYIAIGIAAIAGIRSCNGTQEVLDIYQKAPRVQVEKVVGQIARDVAVIAGIESCNRTQMILDNYQKASEVHVRNVIGQEAPEKFYDLDGQRVYLEIDGKPVEQYVREK